MVEELIFWLTTVASVFSIVGFVITIYVAWGIRKIKLQMLRRVRLPELHEKLIAHKSRISDSLNTYKGNEEQAIKSIREELSEAIAHVKYLQEKTKRTGVTSTLTRLRETMADELKKDTSVPKDIRRIYNSMNTAITEIENLVDDEKWS